MTENEIEYRRRVVGVPMSMLALRAGLPYSRVWHGLRGTKLSADELKKLATAVEAFERVNHTVAAAV